MPEPRFLQIHTLTSYTAALLNRDDSGLAKRLTYGGSLRTRISSQCMKRHWRLADDPHALHAIEGADAAFRSRELVTHKVLGGLGPEDVLQAIEPCFKKPSTVTRARRKKADRHFFSGSARSHGFAARPSG